MRHTAFAFAVFVIATSPWAASSETVGISGVAIPGDADSPSFDVTLWYPASGGELENFGSSRIRPGYLASTEAAVALERHSPLIVLIHGSGGSADSMAWIATELAKRGVLVAAADHPASSGGNPERASIIEVWRQPRDVSHLIDRLLESDWKDFIDPKRIGVVGFSLGGSAAMSLAGTQFRIEQFVQFCQEHSDGACDALSHHFEGREKSFYSRANGYMADRRVRAAVALAPGFTESVTEESVRSLTTPLLLIVGMDDGQLPPATHITSAWKSLPAHSEIVEFDETQHFSFLPLCRDDATTVLAETGEEFVCQETGEKSREQIHEATISVLDQFFRENGVFALNDDAN